MRIPACNSRWHVRSASSLALPLHFPATLQSATGAPLNPTIRTRSVCPLSCLISRVHKRHSAHIHNETHEKHTPRLVPRCLRWRRALSAALRLPCLKQSSLGIGCRRGFPGFGLLKFYNMFNFFVPEKEWDLMVPRYIFGSCTLSLYTSLSLS